MTKRVAVVAVHGVADQQPHDSAWQVAGLLTAFGAGYVPWTGREIQLPLEPLHVPAENAPSDGSPGYEFMVGQLRKYRREDLTFNTILVEGAKKDGAEEKTVDVYEAYWADLSRLAPGVFDFFAELYQLVLHLPSLGRTVARREATLHGEDHFRWNLFARAQQLSVWMLVVLIVLLNVVLLTFIPPVFVTRLDRTPALQPKNPTATMCWRDCPKPQYECAIPEKKDEAPVELPTWVFVAIATAVVGAFAAVLARDHDEKLNAVVAYAAPLLVAGATAVVTTLEAGKISYLARIGFLTWLLFAGVAAVVMSKYSFRRPGAMLWTLILLTISGALFLWRLSTPDVTLLNAAMQTIDVLNVVLRIVWVAHIALMAVAALAGLFAAYTSKKRREEARRAAWTARATIGLSSSLFGLLTLSIWGAILLTAEKLLPARCIQLLPLDGGSFVKPFGDAARQMMGDAAHFMPLTAITLAVFLTSVLAAIFPSVLLELKGGAGGANAMTPSQTSGRGRWLARGLVFVPFVLNLLLIAGAVLFFAGLSRIPSWAAFVRSPHAGMAFRWAAGAGAVIIALVTGRLAIPGASNALDVALDVDNYLREHPDDRTPRARIAERVTSLLRHVANENYDEVIIVAHSQGTVITADLLRFMRILHSDIYDRLKGKITFFTMGSPLRQLYENAFPPLYDWMDPLPKPAPLTEIGAKLWVNAYRTSDYVGRWIWRGAKDAGVWKKSDINLPPTLPPWLDLCIGAGAHTHYWDDTGEAVGRILDQLIDRV